MNKTMVIGLSVLLCLYLAFGLIGCARAQDMGDPTKCTNEQGIELDISMCGGPDGEPVAVYMIATTSADMHQWVWSSYKAYETRKQCERVALPHQKCVALLGNMPR
jgi:hypothetical protein